MFDNEPPAVICKIKFLRFDGTVNNNSITVPFITVLFILFDKLFQEKFHKISLTSTSFAFFMKYFSGVVVEILENKTTKIEVDDGYLIISIEN